MDTDEKYAASMGVPSPHRESREEAHIRRLTADFTAAQQRADAAEARNAELEKALRGVIRESDRKTDAYDFARAALARTPTQAAERWRAMERAATMLRQLGTAGFLACDMVRSGGCPGNCMPCDAGRLAAALDRIEGGGEMREG